MLARLNASVIISAPPSSATALIRLILNLPEPRINLELNSLTPFLYFLEYLKPWAKPHGLYTSSMPSKSLKIILA